VPYLESPGVHRIDLVWNGHPGQVAAYLLDGGEGLAVVETGPTSTLPAVLGAIREIGRAPEDVTHLLVTHVHLDHAAAPARCCATRRTPASTCTRAAHRTCSTPRG